ncbi:hypothetical protein RYZ26_06010 [Terasakiella sp. A23]|uniref:hypothetical protein n=1 Tax=Terasakiella sp. FCG-A23 TaxID=3080561 RepID=UPI002953257D|nr:hypothetical protein [Terasakiella sp. A23]MDV7339137.1 hypothetical protein [Terasakiella sp. A23]
MRNSVIGVVIGLVVGVVLGVTILTPKLKTHAASKSVLSERDLEKDIPAETAPVLAALQDGDVIHWRSAPPFPSDRPNVARQAHEYSKQLATISGDKMVLPVLPAKDVISADNLFGAVASGRIDALFTTADIAVHKEPALNVFSAIPFGPKPADTLAWLHAGKGTAILQDLFGNHNINALVCGYLAPEAGGWFTKELQGTEDLKKLRIRANGLGAKVWEKVGAEISTITSEEIMAAFDQDKLDAAIFSTPAVDAKTGFSKFAKNYYYPGWQNQGQPLFLLFNSRAWKRLDEERRSLLKATCDQQTTLAHAAAAKKQFQGLSEITKQEVNLRRMPSYILDRLREEWKDVLAEQARTSSEFRETWEDLNKFIETRKTWEEMGHLSQTGKPF